MKGKLRRNNMVSLLKIIEEKPATESSLPSFIVKRVAEDNLEESPKKERDDRPYILRIYVGEKVIGGYPVYMDTNYTPGFNRNNILQGVKENIELARELAYDNLKFHAQIISDTYKMKLIDCVK